MLEGKKRVHLIGIGGIGVSGVARLLHEQGHLVSGSDVRESQITEALRALGITVGIGHDTAYLDGVDIVIYSTAIPDSNPEKIAAKERGIALVHRAEVLGEMVNHQKGIGVLGTHGKGTTAGMLTWALDSAGYDPGFYIGGLLNNYGINSRYRDGFFVIEIDESDGSQVHLRPTLAIINNLEADHLNFYDDFDQIVDTLSDYIRENPATRFVMNIDCPGVSRLVETALEVGAPVRTFGFEGRGDVRGEGLRRRRLGSDFNVVCDGHQLGELSLNLAGAYNASNALAATTALLWLDVPFSAVAGALSEFRGLENRFQLEDAAGISIIKDYISHPTGIRRVLEAARDCQPRKIYAVFKPYRFTLINYLQDEYAVAFQDADLTLLTEMYTAGEVPIAGVDEQFLLDKIRGTGSQAEFIPEMSDIRTFLLENLETDDLVIFLGGDDLFRFADALRDHLIESR